VHHQRPRPTSLRTLLDAGVVILKALVVVAHPDPESFAHAAARRVERGLEAAGHSVEVIDLGAIDYPGALRPDEWREYESESPVLDPIVAAHIELVRSAEALVFVYPTWWSSLPAVLKAWFERTLVPGVAFVLDPRTRRVRPALGHVRHLVGVTTYGSPRWYVRLVNDNGRRTIARTLRIATGRGTRVTWLPMYSLDGHDEAARHAFLDRIEETMRGLR
jgi:putative NADPH-quinone reductase